MNSNFLLFFYFFLFSFIFLIPRSPKACFLQKSTSPEGFQCISSCPRNTSRGRHTDGVYLSKSPPYIKKLVFLLVSIVFLRTRVAFWHGEPCSVLPQRNLGHRKNQSFPIVLHGFRGSRRSATAKLQRFRSSKLQNGKITNVFQWFGMISGGLYFSFHPSIPRCGGGDRLRRLVGRLLRQIVEEDGSSDDSD